MLNLLASRRLTSADNHVLTRADTMSPYGAKPKFKLRHCRVPRNFAPKPHLAYDGANDSRNGKKEAPS
jgi:hypothetical protein